MGTMKTDKAKVNGAEVTGTDKTKLDQIIEKMEAEQAEGADFSNLVNIELSSEIVGTLRGHFSENLIYNIPRRSSTGKTEHRECERMKGRCPYKGQKHIHIVGVGYQGALTAMRAYGRMVARVEDIPEIVDQGDRLYWAAYGEATDRHTGNDIGRWYLEPVMRKSGNKFIENEFGASIAQSKALRNVILALIPAKLMEGWIEDYKSGKQEFSVERAKAMGYGPQEQKEAPKRKRREKTKPNSNTSTQGERDLESVTNELAEQLSVDSGELSRFSSVHYDTKARAILAFNRALHDELILNDISKKFTDWKAKQGDVSDTTEVQMDLANQPIE
ncbi:MAG: hypothetical protein ACYTEW_27275 [Planctomycetota bacterium]|jgi:hypothetical protein